MEEKVCVTPLCTVCVGIVRLNRLNFRGKIPRLRVGRPRLSRVMAPFLSQHNYIPEFFLGQAAASL